MIVCHPRGTADQCNCRSEQTAKQTRALGGDGFTCSRRARGILFRAYGPEKCGIAGWTSSSTMKDFPSRDISINTLDKSPPNALERLQSHDPFPTREVLIGARMLCDFESGLSDLCESAFFHKLRNQAFHSKAWRHLNNASNAYEHVIDLGNLILAANFELLNDGSGSSIGCVSDSRLASNPYARSTADVM